MIDQKELDREEQFWDKVGDQWLAQYSDESLAVKDFQSFLSGSSVAFEHLLQQVGDVQGKRLLDYGCGSGWLSTFFAQRGAVVEGFDISSRLVLLGMKRARANGVGDRVHLERMIAEQLAYPENSFDLVIGISILHHISLEEGGRELHRVLKPGGRAFFIEPLGENGFQNMLRNYIFRVHHGQVRAVDAEHPLTYADIRKIGAPFNSVVRREFQLTEMVARVTGEPFTRALGLRKLDELLLARIPSLRRFCRLVVITYSK